MLTLGAQWAISLCLLAFGLAAFRVAREMVPGPVAFRWAWAVTGTTFFMQGANKLTQDAFATYAFISGPDSRAWNSYLWWTPLLNHSRTFLLVGYCASVSIYLLSRRNAENPPGPRTVFRVLLGAMLLGAAVGWQEDAFSGLTHYTAVAIWDIVELLSMLALLLVGLHTGKMERGLWGCLSINAFILTLSVLWFAALSRIDVAGEWAPRPWHIQVTKAALYCVMTAVALRQLRRIRSGERLQGFFEPASSRLRSMHG